MMGVLKHYGDYIVSGELADRTTIHGSGTIDIEVNPEGQIVQHLGLGNRRGLLPGRLRHDGGADLK